MAISHSTVRANTWTAVNAGVAAATSKTILAKFPDDPTRITAASYPIVVMSPAQVEADGKFFGSTNNPKEITVFVDVYSNNPADIDTVSDQIANYFETTRIDDVHLVAVNDSDVDVLTINNLNIAFRIISITFSFL